MTMRLILGFALIVAGCVSQPTRYKADTPEKQARLDKATADCQYELSLAIRTPLYVAQGHWLAADDIEKQKIAMMPACMARKGWKVPEKMTY